MVSNLLRLCLILSDFYHIYNELHCGIPVEQNNPG